MGEAVCVLIRDDGSYRLEKLFRVKAEMYTGKASDDQVKQLAQILGNAQLGKLSQENVSGDITSDTLDQLDVAIWRQRGWQTLSFHNASSRKPFNGELDPLMRWFENLQKKRPEATRVEGAATRCLPDKELHPEAPQTVWATVEKPGVSSEADRNVPSPSTARLEPVYLFRSHSAEFGRGKLKAMCTVVYTDGMYRREERFESISGSKTDRSYGGQINADSLAELKLVLDSSDLKNAHSDTGTPQWAGDGESSEVFIPRGNEIQHLKFASRFNTSIRPLDQGGMSNMAYHVADQQVLDPLKNWMKHHTDKLEGGGESSKAALNDCFPAKGN